MSELTTIGLHNSNQTFTVEERYPAVVERWQRGGIASFLLPASQYGDDLNVSIATSSIAWCRPRTWKGNQP